ncbi:hypothetical protein CFOL_v3_20936 [Cephalotus follicularis]|uniref:Retrotransposon gag domain-containing protein n=1 Tax=Cephalotus follicularis TaxID=3775 RepID=A0A1Q3CB60_CEPFO|nr:hypothetical protein CFOL_v3_20936 [Cephalotus follicularis]
MFSLGLGTVTTPAVRGCYTNSTAGICRSKVIKMDFPRYKAEDDPTSWVCRANQYFDYHQTPEDERVPLDSWNLEGDAQMWYQVLKEGHENGPITWQEFTN